MTPRLRGHECATALLPRARIPLPLATVPIGHHPRLVRIARNLPVPQKWYKRIIYLHLIRHRTIGRSWLRAPAAVLGSSELKSADRLLVGVRAPRWCPLVHCQTRCQTAQEDKAKARTAGQDASALPKTQCKGCPPLLLCAHLNNGTQRLRIHSGEAAVVVGESSRLPMASAHQHQHKQGTPERRQQHAVLPQALHTRSAQVRTCVVRPCMPGQHKSTHAW